MIEKYILLIYEKTYAIIKSGLDNPTERELDLYYNYLTNKYEAQLTDIANSESTETVKKVVEMFIKDEINIWTGLSNSEIMSSLESDSAYEHLCFLSNIAFEQAKICFRDHKYYNNDEEYKFRLEEILSCLDEIKPFNIDYAKEILSETILDIDYIFGKSENTSLRLAHVF